MIYWLSIPIPVPTLPFFTFYLAVGLGTVIWLLIDDRTNSEIHDKPTGIRAGALAVIAITWPVFYLLVLKGPIKRALRRSA